MVNRLSFAAATLLSAGMALGATAAFAAPESGRITIAATLDAPAASAARTFQFSISDGENERVIALPVSSSTGVSVATVDGLPGGDYTVRPLLSADVALECGDGALYKVSSPALPAPVRPTGAGVRFTFAPCESVQAAISAPADVESGHVGPASSMLAIGSSTNAPAAIRLPMLLGALGAMVVVCVAIRAKVFAPAARAHSR